MKHLQIDNYEVNTPIIDILETIKRELGGAKLHTIREKTDYISVTCPSHNNGQEKRPSCGIYIGDGDAEYGSFNCFTCGQHGSFVHFVALCFDTTDSTAKKWLIKHFGEKNTELKLELEPIILKKTEKNTYLDEKILEDFQSYHPYMDKRKLSKKVCETFKIKYDPKSECLVFPVWDERGNLYMLTRRSVKNKTFIIDKNKDKPVYLLNFIRKNNIPEITICESQINALTLWGWQIPAVATFGCNITDKQVEILNKSGIKHIYLAFDGDEAGKKGTKKLISKLNKSILIDVIEIPAGKDVNDLTEEEFNKLPIVSSYNWLVDNKN